MKERNIILEGKLKSWLLSVDIEKLAAKQQGQLILGLEKLYPIRNWNRVMCIILL